jgi:hypothetical protein
MRLMPVTVRPGADAGVAQGPACLFPRHGEDAEPYDKDEEGPEDDDTDDLGCSGLVEHTFTSLWFDAAGRNQPVLMLIHMGLEWQIL